MPGACGASRCVLDIARDVEDVCPDALFLNVSNPLTALCRAVDPRDEVQTVGLCNECVAMQFALSLLFDAGMQEIDPVVGGVNHFPLVTELHDARRGCVRELARLLDDPEACRPRETMWMDPPDGMEYEKVTPGDRWHKADVLAQQRGPASSCSGASVCSRLGRPPRHGVRAGFVHARNDFGQTWKVHVYRLAKHMADADDDVANYESRPRLGRRPTVARPASWSRRSLDALLTGQRAAPPGQHPELRQRDRTCPTVLVVEIDGHGRRRRRARARPDHGAVGVMGEYLRRVHASQELHRRRRPHRRPHAACSRPCCRPDVPADSPTTMSPP